MNLTLEEWSALAQLGLTAITFVGIAGSLFLSVRALREVQEDRRQRQRPHLAFQGGGMRLPIEFVKAGKRIPGVDPKYVESVLPNLPENAESVRIRENGRQGSGPEPIFYGSLKNYGLGPALETRVTWVPETVKIGSERFQIDGEKLREPQYSYALNTMPPWQRHIPAGEQSELTRLPTFIEKDHERKVSQVEGVLKLVCEDVFAEKHVVHQEFFIETAYDKDRPYVHVTFRDIRDRGRDA